MWVQWEEEGTEIAASRPRLNGRGYVGLVAEIVRFWLVRISFPPKSDDFGYVAEFF
jgi:hypothetical protein